MDWFEAIADDFKYQFMQDIDARKIIFALFMVGILAVIFLSKKIAERFKTKESEIASLSIWIKNAAFALAVAVALAVTIGG